MKFATLFTLALCFAGLAVAQDDPLNPLPDAASAKVETLPPPLAAPKGHYVTICDGRSCRQVFVPDAPPNSTEAHASVEIIATPAPRLFYVGGSPTYCVQGDGTCTETRVAFMDRGPIRRALKAARGRTRTR